MTIRYAISGFRSPRSLNPFCNKFTDSRSCPSMSPEAAYTLLTPKRLPKIKPTFVNEGVTTPSTSALPAFACAESCDRGGENGSTARLTEPMNSDDARWDPAASSFLTGRTVEKLWIVSPRVLQWRGYVPITHVGFTHDRASDILSSFVRRAAMSATTWCLRRTA